MEREIAVMRSVYQTVVVKKELSRKDKIMRIQAAEMSFLRRVAGRSLRDRVRSSVTREELSRAAASFISRGVS
ncbi:hypothetical protein L3Q82_019975 [Scortum barcoo]|uniref:Uncharacterized protein n=1 Tax=Scortum barcoo TaxID=214431 RepID=A0ACB8VCW5_9TELE|nr:hypothetical protein L3Q82_019975 [Scortum barcoo]